MRIVTRNTFPSYDSKGATEVKLAVEITRVEENTDTISDLNTQGEWVDYFGSIVLNMAYFEIDSTGKETDVSGKAGLFNRIVRSSQVAHNYLSTLPQDVFGNDFGGTRTMKRGLYFLRKHFVDNNMLGITNIEDWIVQL